MNALDMAQRRQQRPMRRGPHGPIDGLTRTLLTVGETTGLSVAEDLTTLAERRHNNLPREPQGHHDR